MARYCGTLTKKKLAYGGQMVDQSGSYNNLRDVWNRPYNFGGQDETKFGVQNEGAAIGGGALKGLGAGASAGAAIGSVVPGLGTAVGGVVGGIVGGVWGGIKGAFTNNQAKVARNRQRGYIQSLQSAQGGANTFSQINNQLSGDQSGSQYGGTKPQFAAGGPMKGKLPIIKGGHLKPVGESVEVKGNKPSIKDGVETPTAKLDDGELIDAKNRVYSDRIRHHDGRSMAQHAKAIEQRRSVNPQADQDLDDLFAYQEAQKPTTMKFNSNPPPSKAYQKSTAITVAPAGAKQHLAGGGELDPGKRLKLRTGSAAASARPSVNGATITADELKRIQGQTNTVKIPFRTREKIVPVKDRVNPLRKPGFAEGGQMNPGQPTRMGLFIKKKAATIERQAGGPTQRPVKIKNFSRSGYR